MFGKDPFERDPNTGQWINHGYRSNGVGRGAFVGEAIVFAVAALEFVNQHEIKAGIVLGLGQVAIGASALLGKALSNRSTDSPAQSLELIDSDSLMD